MGLLHRLFGMQKKSENPDFSKNKDFTPSDKLMDEGVFWQVIEKVKNNSHNDYEEQQKLLAHELHALTPNDLIVFDNRFRFFRGKANTWELWAAIYIIHGGCGDDCFSDFREWVISQGKDFYYRTVENPETLIEMPQEEIDIEWEGMGYIPSTVFEEMTGQAIPSLFIENFTPTGKEWNETDDDLKIMFPRLYEKYSDDR